MGKTRYNYISVPVVLVDLVDKAVEANSYPLGKYHSRAHFVHEAIKNELKKEGLLEKKNE